MKNYAGYWFLYVGAALLVLDIEYSIEDYALVKWENEKRVTHCKIYTTRTGRNYIRKAGRRWYFDECIRA